MNSLTISPQKRNQPVINDPAIPFVSVLAHELRNPLTNIMLTVHLLESKILDDNDRTYMDIIKRSSTKINDLINELLKGGQNDDIQTEKYSIHQLLDEVIEITSDKILLKNIVVKKNYTSYDLKVLMDRQKMRIALTNIIINAIDAMGLENGELRIVTKLINGRYALSIQDNGCGISKENLRLIFKPYFTTKPKGGVGLAATKDILQSHEVDVKVESAVGEGTKFILLFEKNKIVAGRKKLKIDQPGVSRNKTLAPVACMTCAAFDQQFDLPVMNSAG